MSAVNLSAHPTHHALKTPMHPNAARRHQVLEMLYHALACKPDGDLIFERGLKKLGNIDFALSCLQKLGHVKQDGFNTEITGAGILAYEEACSQAA